MMEAHFISKNALICLKKKSKNKNTFYKCALLFKSFWKMFLMLTKAAFIWSKNTVKTVILWNIITI